MKLKYIIAIILSIFIIGGVIIIFMHSGEMFRYEINVTYPDGCIETYNRGDLISPMCEYGRELAEEIERERMEERHKEWETPIID